MPACRGCNRSFLSAEALGTHKGRCDAIKNLEEREAAAARAQFLAQAAAEDDARKRKREEAAKEQQAKRARKDQLLASYAGSTARMIHAPAPFVHPPSPVTILQDFELTSVPSPSESRHASPEQGQEDGIVDPVATEATLDDGATSATQHRYPLRRRLVPVAQNVPPEGPEPLPPAEQLPSLQEPEPDAQEQDPPSHCVTTKPNGFGVWRRYPHRPERDPAELAELDDAVVPKLAAPKPASAHPKTPVFRPGDDSKEANHQRLHEWMTSGSGQKSVSDTEVLVHRVFRHEGFRPEHFQDSSWKTSFLKAGQSNGSVDDWRNVPLHIDIPIQKKYRDRNNQPESARFCVGDFHYRPLCGVIRALAEKDPAASRFIYNPYEEFVRTVDNRDVRLHGELYASPAWLEEHEKIQQLVVPAEKENGGGKLPRAIFACMFGSDAALLAQFGTDHVWPNYFMTGNQTKYERSKPSMHAVHQIAHFPELPDAVQDFITTRSGGAEAKSALLTLCKRQTIHESWRILLDDEFLEAYEWGMAVICADGVQRLLFPRIFTYSADYPEKCIIATLKDFGKCPCPRCLVTKAEIPQVGQRRDMQRRETTARTDSTRWRNSVKTAHKDIFQRGIAVDSRTLDDILTDSTAPGVKNAFSERLGPLLFNLFHMLVVDLLHEFEIGVWKAIFIHMLRILHATDKDLLAELNRRFRSMPTFGRATIRKFHNNVSDMKRLAARDFEDILQCAYAAFDRLLPEPYNKLFMRLIFEASKWHALAKLRLHSDVHLAELRKTTTDLTDLLRTFTRETANIDTTDLPRELAARQRRAAAQAIASGKPAATVEPRLRKFNLTTYKLHSLPDYAPTIGRVGTTDSYSTRLVEVTHRQLKRANRITNHHNQVPQLAAIEQRGRRVRLLAGGTPAQQKAADVLPYTAPHLPFHIAADKKHAVDISRFTASNSEDPATKNFYVQLKSHLLERMGVQPDLPDERFSEPLRRTIVLENNKLYLHKVLRINYTTYDLRRDQDSINPATPHCDIMFLSPEERRNAHPYWYARVLSIFHVAVRRRDSRPEDPPQRFDVLWIRWFGEDPEWVDGWSTRRLPRVGFVPASDPDAFGFLDPAAVLRGCHMLPAFQEGRTDELLPFPESIARDDDEDDDWVNYYVGIFVDRDMVMRYLGGGVGHRWTVPRHRSNRWLSALTTVPSNTTEPTGRRREEGAQRPVPEDGGGDGMDADARASSAPNATASSPRAPEEPATYELLDEDEEGDDGTDPEADPFGEDGDGDEILDGELDFDLDRLEELDEFLDDLM